MKVAVVKETYPGERRVALIPANVPPLQKAGYEVLVQAGAGELAGFRDEDYQQKGALVVASREEAFAAANFILQVRGFGANTAAGEADLERMRYGQYFLGLWDPLGNPAAAQQAASRGVSCLALELVPRITRAQSMDVLSSMATIAGYRAVLLAAIELPKMFPLLMTAAGTLTAARVFVIGAGVAGLQAIATAKRLGAIVHAYDVRAATREQVESVGGKFVELPLDAGQAEDRGGYAKALGEDFYQRQRALLGKIVSESDVVITTAAIPGKPSPLLITTEAVRQMAAGSVIVDLAAERGGNCELSQPDQRVVDHGVVILAPTNLPTEIPRDASQMFGNNTTKFLLGMIREKQFQLDLTDEIQRETLLTRDGHVVHARLRELLGLPPLDAPPSTSDTIPFDSDSQLPPSTPAESSPLKPNDAGGM